MKFWALIKDKRFRYGTMSTAMMIFAVVIFVLVNLLADEFNRSWDLTDEQLYTLSDQSHRFLAELEMDVTLYYVARTGAESHLITQLLAEYSAASPRITTETRDPMINPTFVHQFITGAETGIPDGSVIVQSVQGFRIITPADMETWNVNPQTWQRVRESIDAEREITQAIHALTRGNPPVIYHITGSGEGPLPEAFVEFLEAENFIVREHNALMNDIPETADMLFITMPPRDWGSVKADRILYYLEQHEGRAFFALSFTFEPFPELSRVLQAYGLELGNYVVLEGNAGLTFMGNPMWMVPILGPHEDIIDPLTLHGFRQLFLEPTGIEISDMRRPSTRIEPLLASSRDSYGRHLDSDVETMLQIPQDEVGPFYLAVAVTDTVFVDTTLTTRLVVVPTMTLLMSEVNNFVGGGNFAFVANSLNWLYGQPPGIWIPVRRPPGGAPVMLSDAQVFTMSGIAMGVLPIIALGMGLFVWFRRRHS